MTTVRTYRDLDAWQAAMDIVVLTYALTALLPECERYGLSAQMRRAAVSVPSNVAEGYGRASASGTSSRGTLYFISIAIGSVGELDTQIEVALRLKFVTTLQCRELQACLARTRQLLYGLRRRHQRLIASAGAR